MRLSLGDMNKTVPGDGFHACDNPAALALLREPKAGVARIEQQPDLRHVQPLKGAPDRRLRLAYFGHGP